MIKIDNVDMPINCSCCPCHDGENDVCRLAEQLKPSYEERPSSCPMTNAEPANIATIDTIKNRVERMICKFCTHYNDGKWSEPCVLCKISQVYMILYLARGESEDEE